MKIVYSSSIKVTLLALCALVEAVLSIYNGTKSFDADSNAPLLARRFSVLAFRFNTNRLLIETINFANLRYCVTSIYSVLFPVFPVQFSVLYIGCVHAADMIRIFSSYAKITSKLSPSVHFSNYLSTTLQATK
jgi:hypothetical protein